MMSKVHVSNICSDLLLIYNYLFIVYFFGEQSLLKEARLTTFNLFAVFLNKHLNG